MKPKTVIVWGLAGVALIIVYQRKEQISSEDPTFREGYLAGFLTPGPFTILALAGFVHLYA